MARGKWEGDELKAKEIESKKLGDRTWALLYWEISTFVVGILLFMASLVLAYWPKLV